jgi:TonB family protein
VVRLLKHGLLVALVLAMGAGRQARAQELPVLLEAPAAPYPEAALAAGLEGTVLLSLEVSALGEVLHAEVTEPAGHGFDEAALEAASGFRFTPARTNTGEPVEATITYRYIFSVEDVPAVALAGQVRAAGTRQPLAAAHLILLSAEGHKRSATTDKEGGYRIADVPDGDYALVAEAAGFAESVAQVKVVAGEIAETTFYLRPSRRWEQQQADDEMIVEGERIEPELVERRLSADEVQRMPGTSGDIVRAVQSLPGVARSPFNAGQLVVRGTAPGDSAFTLGGAPIPIVFHFGGLSTILSPDILGEVAYMPGSYGVRYGRRLGGAVDLRTDKSAPERSRGYASVDLFQASLFVQGIISERWSLTFSGRRSYIDTLLAPVINQTESASVRLPSFTDAQLRALYRADDGGSVDIMVFTSDDRFSYTELDPDDPSEEVESLLKVQLSRGWLQWQEVLGGGWTTELTASGGPEETSATYQGEDEIFDERRSGALRLEAVRAVPAEGWAGWRLGIDVLAEEVAFSYAVEELSSFTTYTSDEAGEAQVLYPSVYVEQTQRAGRLEGVPGVRVDAMLTDTDFVALTVDPRLALRFQATDQTRLRAGIGRYSQFPLLRELIEPAGQPNLTPEWALQASAGVDHDFSAGFSGELTVYHLWLRDLVIGREDRFEFVLGPPPTPPLDTDAYANDATGLSTGAEGLLRYEDPRVAAWLGATLSRSTRVKRPGADRGRFEYDQPLVLTAAGSYKLPRSISLGARLRLASGNPYTPVANRGFDLDEHTWYPIYDLDNSARMPAFFALDLRIDKAWTFERWQLTGYLDLQNATNRRNVELINWSRDWSEELRVYGLPIIPAFGLKGAW